mgnify:CR=1 FL=1|tara:strand:+ start:1844 stop:3256 length:1413 start_codon:yes stop_codon:yes gene_type:complete
MGTIKKQKDNTKNLPVSFNLKKTKSNKIKKLSKNEILDVIIVGAGASGISAGVHLQQHQKRVLILEARDRIGGRVHDTYVKGFGKIPLGAAWLHYKQNAWKNYHYSKHFLKELLDKHDVKYVKSEGLSNKDTFSLYNERGQLFKDKKMLKLLNDLPDLICNECQKYPSKSITSTIKKILSKYKLPSDIVGSFINRSLEHCSLNSDNISCKNYDCWKPNGDIVIDGYGKLLTKLSQDLKIKLNSEVVKIEQTDLVTVTTKDGHQYRCRKLISTVPYGVLQSDRITFIPPLPSNKRRSLRTINSSFHEKIFLSFPHKFWDPQKDVFHYSHPKNRGLCSQWQSLPLKTNKHILYTNLSGPAESYAYKSDDQLKKISMTVLKTIFGKNIPDPIDIYVTKWKLDPFTKGAAYSYPKNNSSLKNMDIISQTFGNIHFAGVDTSSEITETVEAAILSGVRVSREIMELDNLNGFLDK